MAIAEGISVELYIVFPCNVSIATVPGIASFFFSCLLLCIVFLYFYSLSLAYFISLFEVPTLELSILFFPCYLTYWFLLLSLSILFSHSP